MSVKYSNSGSYNVELCKDKLLMKLSYLSFLLISLSCLLTSCRKDKIQAENSIEGDWKVTEIITQYGAFLNNTFVSDSTRRNSGDLGTFTFTAENVSYNVILNQLLFSGNQGWSLTYERVNSGFVRVPKYTLTIGTEFIFDVFFEDGTRNAEKNAKLITLTQIPALSDQLMMTLTLRKE